MVAGSVIITMPLPLPNLMQSDHGINDSGYDNPEYDKLLQQAANESDLEKRKGIMEAAERMLLRIMPSCHSISMSPST